MDDELSARELRQAIIDRAARGEITSDQAEHDAALNGLSPLVSRPGGYDPMSELDWSLAMTVAWIATKNVDEVCDVWNAYRAQSTHWDSFALPGVGDVTAMPKIGWSIVARSPVALMDLLLGEHDDSQVDAEPAPTISFSNAKRDLWQELRKGTLMATAADGQTNEIKQIPSHEWGRLDLATDGNYEDVLRFDTGIDRLKVAYRDIRFATADIVKIWPIDTGGVKRRGRPPLGECDLIAALTELDHSVESAPNTKVFRARLSDKLKFGGHLSKGDDALRKELERLKKKNVPSRTK